MAGAQASQSVQNPSDSGDTISGVQNTQATPVTIPSNNPATVTISAGGGDGFGTAAASINVDSTTASGSGAYFFDDSTQQFYGTLYQDWLLEANGEYSLSATWGY